MVRESRCKVAIVGGGPAGCFCAYHLQQGCDVTVFEAKSPLLTLLPTGGGRCNISYLEYDFRELATNYPRGEKFLYSIFLRFGVAETLAAFEQIGVETYVQEDMRIFPVSNSASDVREKFLKALNKTKFIEEKVLRVYQNENGFGVKTNRILYQFDKIVVAIGGHAGFELAQNLGHKIIEPKPSLAGLKTSENFAELSGVSFKNVTARFDNKSMSGDVMFTHTGITGPLIYKISSLKARDEFPYKLSIDFVGEIDLQDMLNQNSQKDIKNLLSELVPRSFAEFVCSRCGIVGDTKCHLIDGKTRDKVLECLQRFEITIVGTRPDGEVVTSGGVDLKEINPKTMESKIVSGLYFCGEVLDIDGFCGGFNLQNCWSAAHVVADAVSTEF